MVIILITTAIIHITTVIILITEITTVMVMDIITLVSDIKEVVPMEDLIILIKMQISKGIIITVPTVSERIPIKMVTDIEM